ncbi:diacylglycerol kinase family protein [Bacillus songklensis]|uniref:Diacylglycerol kinase family protein n=1 Tax=Bacillus songklensis TaxID=1069116 RepID=A0ABV8AYA0_9BACI
MALKDKKGSKKPRLVKSFRYAIEGILSALKTERNMKIHAAAAVLVVIAGCYFRITLSDWVILIIVMGGVFSLELINTAIEKNVDLITKDYHPLAKTAKDAAAGAVFIYAVVSVIAGVLIFSKYIL